MYVAEIRKKTIRLLLKCIGVYIILALTLNIQLTLGMGVISFIYFLYRRNLVKKNEIIDCDKYPYYKEEYEDMDDIPLTYFLVTFKENNFIPVGTQCVFLDENTMLVGAWGDVILAHRLE